MRALADTASGLGQVFSNYGERQYKIQTAQEYNSARVSMLRETNNFLLDLEKNADYKSYLPNFEQFQRTAYDKINAGIMSTDAQRQFEADWKLQMENLRMDVQQLSLTRSRSFSRGEMLLELDELIEMPATGTLATADPAYDADGNEIDKRTAFVGLQKGRIQDILTAGVVGGYLTPEEHTAMLAKYVPAFEKTFVANEALKMVRSGADLEEVEQWIIDQQYVSLGVADRESIISATRNESVVHQSRQMDQAAAQERKAIDQIVGMWSDPEQWQFLAANNFRAIRESAMSVENKEHFIDKVSRRLDAEASKVANGLTEAEYAKVQQGYTADLLGLVEAGDKKALQDFVNRSTADKNLTESDRRYYAVAAQNEVNRIITREAGEEEARLEAEEEQRKTEEHLREWKDARSQLELGTLTKPKIDAYKTFNEEDLTLWYNELEQWQLRKEGEDAKLDPYKTRPEVETRIFELFWNGNIPPDVVEREIKLVSGDGLSLDDAESYLKDLPRRDELIRDPIVTEYGDALDSFFNSQYYSDMTNEERGEVAMEHAAAMAAFRGLNSNPNIRSMPESSRRKEYDDLLRSIVERPTTRRLNNLFGKEVVELYTPQRLRQEWQRGAPEVVLKQQIDRIGQAMIEEYREENIGPTDGMEVQDDLVDGYIVFLHVLSGTYFRKAGNGWDIGKMENGEINWKNWRRNRMEDYTAQ